MKKTLFTLFTAINLVLLYCPAALALTEDEAAAAVNVRHCFSQGQHQAGRHPALAGHRRFTFARLNAVRSSAGFPWF